MHTHRYYCRALLVALLMLSAVGCASNRAKKGFAWPWTPEKDDAVGITTPAQRLADMTAMASQADKQSPAEQERVSGDLAKQIQEEQDPMIRRYIVLTLGHYKTASATAVLQAAVSDSDTTVRIAACEAWGRRGGLEAAERLTGLLSSDTNLDVRLAAARAIGKTHEKSAVQPLAEALSDADPAIQYSVAGALKEISGKDYGNDVNLWRAYARGENPPPPEGPSIAQRVRNFF
ncbi:MAG TPA: HEAT repeat domain-containing protein [Pirellulales bacterium]|jgi:HEAT repeat protein|nr:HEAT repeat domain-containing protein [Pirellulales bacterium]